MPMTLLCFMAWQKKNLIPGEFHFKHTLQDIETLNHRAAIGELDVTAISVHAYPYVQHNYALLTAGGSLGINYGPLVVSKKDYSFDDLKKITIAIPGKLTSAYLALRLCIGEFNFDVVPFDQIIPAILDDRVDAGLIIHEGQLYFGDKGTQKNHRFRRMVEQRNERSAVAVGCKCDP